MYMTIESSQIKYLSLMYSQQQTHYLSTSNASPLFQFLLLTRFLSSLPSLCHLSSLSSLSINLLSQLSTTIMPPKPSSRKGAKKGVSKTESSAETQPPKIKTEIPSPTPASVANDANEKSSATPANETTNGNVKNTKKSSPPKVKMEDIPEANPRVQRPSNPVSTTFSIADLDRFAFSYGALGSDDDISPVPSLVENIAEQARTAKHVRFFMNTTHDKHFVPIEVPPLTGNANWGPWLAAMRLLFRQHSVWPIVTSELQPLSPNHNLYLWYQRMCDCAVALIYANVSEEVRRTSCFMSTAHEDDADILMSHLYAHYSEPGSSHTHEESELD
ncbi:hypothetical protein ACN38_g965 [Penicillium nordicum]|uniref:Uncharacterized protein n=1 Tax=Penicillium nordicum TaxID=229535 RepID=A0A0M9WK96_9EURO|nr:hypothetical protein ACN38_g965 [Penicillium nordicum]